MANRLIIAWRLAIFIYEDKGMHIQRIEVANVLGLARADITIGGGILLAAGNNMSGKSSLRDAISMALTGAPARVTKKKDMDQLLHGGAKKGRATVYSGGEILGEIKLPKGEFAGPDFAGSEYLPLVLDPSKFASMTNDERRALLFKITGCGVSMKTIEPLLVKRGVDMGLFAEVQAMLRQGFPAACTYAEGQARDGKAVWKATTGETWGSDKADGWEMELPAVTVPTPDEIKAAADVVAATEADIAKGNERKGQLMEQKRQQESSAQRTADLREKAEGLDRHKAKLESTETDLAVWRKKADDLKAQLASAQAAAAGCECPSCGAKLKIEGATLVPYAPANAKAGNVTDLQAKLKEATDARDMLERTQRNDLSLVAAAEQAVIDLAAAEQAEAFNPDSLAKVAEKLNTLQQRLATEKAKASALADLRDQAANASSITQKAAQQHASIMAWLNIKDAMAPDGIPADLLQQALSPFNQSLEVLAGMAGWPLVVVDKNIDITSQGRQYHLTSESEKWRADTLLAIAIAQLTGLKMTVLDRFDVLELKARGQLTGMLCKLVQLQAMDTIVMLGTMKAIPAGMPPEVTCVWISQEMAES